MAVVGIQQHVLRSRLLLQLLSPGSVLLYFRHLEGLSTDAEVIEPRLMSSEYCQTASARSRSSSSSVIVRGWALTAIALACAIPIMANAASDSPRGLINSGKERQVVGCNY